ncbi:mechanosensitive ion channel protein MscS [Zhengella mangrovi]|uniref:Small-conductance mechanosensitive channel n=1 Tax=Zhengella mangrovi TaxID=1982044 RepID=A0A2G1QKW5_9HYPH|nr:mechanosensitive ion channel family protein [Zhengella mangrovi]PHP66119.1 mechanosensitive ion channel protein MscS [Zhengella mangrovi]
MSLRLIAAALLLAVSLVLPVAAEDAPTEPNGPIATKTDVDSDRAIDRRIEEILSQIEGLDDVFSSVKSGVVTLYGQVAEPQMALEAEKLAGRVEGVVAIRNQIREVSSVTKRIVPAWERIRNRTLQIVNQLPMIGLSAIVFLVIASLGFWVAARRWPFSRIAPNSFIADLLRQIVRLVFVGLGLVVALDVLGATAVLGTILGAAGIFGLAVGFAVRDTVENYIASILLSVRQPFRPNDWVEIGGKEGSVLMLTSRATILMDADGNHIRIPNADVFKGIVHNYTRNPERRFSFTFGIDPAADLSAAREIGIRALADLPFTLKDPDPDAWITEAGDFAIVIQYVAWVNQTETSFLQAKSEAIRLVKHALESAGIDLPEPGYRIHLQQEEPVVTTRTKQPKARPSSAAAVADTARADDTIARKVAEERAQSGRQDLLDEDASQEIG